MIARHILEKEWIFIPQAKDGSRFLPALKTKDGFRIGFKNSEKFVSDYFDAIKELLHMTRPTWQRVNESGTTDYFTVERWIKISVKEIKGV